MTVVDLYSRVMVVYLMRVKSEVPQKLQRFMEEYATPEGLVIGALRTDNGSEYLSAVVTDWCKTHGIRREITAPYAHQQAGVA